ncbi:MAG TPA: hypothetical protein PKV71_01400 [Calditrichia bacterium]|nr:DUF2231 domain-containing protein [Calditrichota bacterium]HQU71325.1 hypothetical protein [Calditrichia bacterium]HQV30496.1 hypothetical protein [Calditrichia bacterium]
MFDWTLLHPMVVHFPIALLIAGFLFELIAAFSGKEFFGKAALYLLVLGTAGAVAAYFSGEFAGEGLSESGSLKNALEAHEEAAKMAMGIMVLTAIVRIALVVVHAYRGLYRAAAVLLYMIGVLLVSRTGYYGGELVYKHAAGVQLSLGADVQNAGSGALPPAYGGEDNDDDDDDDDD